MKKVNIFVALAALLMLSSCSGYKAADEINEASQVVSDFYENIRNHDYDNAMLCTDLPYQEAMQMASIFNELGMEIHEFAVDSVTLSTDTTAVVHVSLKVSNAFSPDTAQSTPAIPCIKTGDGWRVKFDF